MGQLRWYKRDPRAALAGMRGLTLEERGAYNTILDLIYVNDGAIADEMSTVAKLMGIDIRVWQRIRTRLLDGRKLYLYDGSLRNERADTEVAAAQQRLSSSAQASLSSVLKRGLTPKKNKHLNGAVVQAPAHTTTIVSKKEYSSINSESETGPQEHSTAAATALLNGAPPPTAEKPKKVAPEHKRPADVTRADLDAIIERKRLARQQEHPSP